MPKTRISVYVDKEQKELLERRSKESGAAVAELIRRAIDAYLRRKP